MKRSLIMAICLALMTATIATANIEIKKDDFDGDITISSTVDAASMNAADIARATMLKTIDVKGIEELNLNFALAAKKGWFFSEQAIDVKITKKNDKGEEESEILKAPFSFKISQAMDYGYIVTGAVFLVPDILSQKIIKAERVTLRVYFATQPNSTWDVPKEALAEWKEVLKYKPPKG
ncbi:MAG: hypothetical protein PHT33_10980 [bacterium]|nr:hypothetical protein [bacterium]